ncbi:Endo-1,4-beta-xylanase Z precursor [Rubripirellula tenax]|uniref:endo-1,4-beta-xylanase n=2 Tax=Rubripirellula tenax TaxID=2528015 RepID=A0A5C6ENF3_9BACT|nr:Endo-1,4-beta-xylanase Z precursor [Rubripirellula tenax]
MAADIGQGLQAQYFDNADLSGTALSRFESGVNFDWGSASPDASISNDFFSARWSGQVEARYTEAYAFQVDADEGARLWVNGQLLVDQFDASGLTAVTATIDLVAGRRYDLVMEYRESTGNASAKLQWSSPSQSLEVVPESQLTPSVRGSIAEDFFAGIPGDALSALTGDADFPSQPLTSSLLSSFQTSSDVGDQFGRRVHGLLHAPVTGAYTFYLAADSTAELRLSTGVDAGQSQKIAEVTVAVAPTDWTSRPEQKSAVIQLVAGQSYFIEALHKESTGADHLAVGWQVPGESSIVVIPGEVLSMDRPTVRIFAETPIAAEGSGSSASFQVVRDGGSISHPLTVHYVTGGSATAGSDYTALSGTVTIPPFAESATILVTPTVDSDIEGDESVTIQLKAGVDYDVAFKSERVVLGTIQDDALIPSGSTSLWTGNSLSDFNQRFGATFSAVSDPTFGTVIQANVTSQPANVFSVQMGQSIDAPVVEGDLLLAEFYVRSAGVDPGTVLAVFEINGPPYTQSLNRGFSVGSNWTKVQLPFAAVESYASGDARFGFQIGQHVQTLQFADIALRNYGQPRTIAPETSFWLNNIGGTWGTAQTVPVSGQTFDSAYEVATTTLPPANWNLQAVERNQSPVANGDTMRIEFSARATSGLAPAAQFAVQRTDTYATLASQNLTIGTAWTPFSFDITVGQAFSTEGLQFVLNVGGALQTLQFGGVTWTNLDNSVDLDELPEQFPSARYEGRSGTDAWRDDAQTRIENERTRTVVVNVRDENGLPIDGAVVSLRQTDHEFRFGSAIEGYGGRLDPNGNTEALKYQSEIKRLFNTVVVENSLKWPGYVNDPSTGEAVANFAASNDLYLRGHNVIWPSRGNMPASVWDEYDSRFVTDGDAAAEAWLADTINARIDQVALDFANSANEWDVVNEPFDNNAVMAILGDDAVVGWYQRLRAADSTLKLALNDYGIFAGNGANTAHRENFEYWIDKLVNANVLDVIGEQSHYNDGNLTDITTFASFIVDYQTRFNTSIAITEFDVNSTDEQLQADYLRDYMTMSFSQPAIEQFLHWGFWEDSHWLPNAALYRSDFSIKPNGQAYEDLVFGNWWTDVRGTTRSGSLTSQAFTGDYEVLVQFGGVSYPATTMRVDGTGVTTVTVDLPVDVSVPAATVSLMGVSYGGATASYGGDEVAPNKQPLMPGFTATEASYTNYDEGLNRVVVDIDHLASPSLTAADFEFRVGNTSDPESWLLLSPSSAIPLPAISVSEPSASGTSRVTLTWPDKAIKNTWVQTTVKVTENTGLEDPVVFYFGNQVADVFSTASEASQLRVTAFDVIQIRGNQQLDRALVGINSKYDINRDGRVTSFDTLIARSNQVLLTGLLMFAAPPLTQPPVQPLVAGMSQVAQQPNIGTTHGASESTITAAKDSTIPVVKQDFRARFLARLARARSRANADSTVATETAERSSPDLVVNRWLEHRIALIQAMRARITLLRNSLNR